MGTESTNTPTNQEDSRLKATIEESGDRRKDLWGPRLFVKNNESKQSKSPEESDVTNPNNEPVITSPVKANTLDHDKSVPKEQEVSNEVVSKDQEEVVNEVVSEQVQSLNIEEDQKPIDEENIISTTENSSKDNDHDGKIEEVCQTSPQPPPHADEKRVPKKNNVSSTEIPKKTKKSQSNTVRKSSHSENAIHADDEEGCSSGYSSTTSMKSSNFQPTVAIGPSFVCGERAAKRKEYYAKLEEKRKAMEAEKMEAEARAKAEHEAALKELRKNLYIKAKPIPSFYKKGPPPKTEPKKIPPTRAKSPKLSQRKSVDGATQGDNQSICYKMNRRSLDGKKESERKSHNGVKNGVAKSSKDERQKSPKENHDAENGIDSESADSRVEEWLKYEKSEGENDVSSEVSNGAHEGEDTEDIDSNNGELHENA